jgi:NIMA (never in mitosis gene a)-related kinase
MWVEQLPPGLARDTRRRCVEAFRRLLFAPGTGPASLKSHLAKLMSAEGDLIRDTTGRVVDFGALPSMGGEGGMDGTSAGGLTYDQLHQVRATAVMMLYHEINLLLGEGAFSHT